MGIESKDRLSEAERQSRGRNLKNGSFSFVLSAVIIAAAVLVNVIFSVLPSSLTQLDFSSSKLYTLTETTESFLNTLSDKVTLYYICEGGKEDDTLDKLLRRYEDASDYITVEQVDPVLYPGFTGQYTDDTVENNSVIIVCGKVSRVVKAENLYVQEFDYNTYSYVNTGFDGEGLITGAIAYVVSDDIPVVYALSGNGENAVAGNFAEAITRNNIDLQELNLLAEDSIPQNAAGIVINAPVRDYNEAETKEILRYLESGGKALVLTNYTVDDMPNLDSILSDYGLQRVEGIILEGRTAGYMTYQYCLLPQIEYSRLTDKLAGGGTYVLTPMAQGIRTAETYRSSIAHTPILTVGSSAYSKVDVQNMTTSEKESQDIDGPFTVGMLVEEDINNDQEAETEFLYISTGYVMDEDYDLNVSGGNSELIRSAASGLFSQNDLSSAVPVKSLKVQYLALTDAAANFWTILCVFVLPAAFVLAGLIIFLRRRKR